MFGNHLEFHLKLNIRMADGYVLAIFSTVPAGGI